MADSTKQERALKFWAALSMRRTAEHPTSLMAEFAEQEERIVVRDERRATLTILKNCRSDWSIMTAIEKLEEEWKKDELERTYCPEPEAARGTIWRDRG